MKIKINQAIDMNLLTIKNYCRAYPGGLRALASTIGMTEANLHRCIQKNKISANDLESIAIALKVNVSSFFSDEAVNGGNDATSAESRRIKDLESALADKEKIINLYERFGHIADSDEGEYAGSEK